MSKVRGFEPVEKKYMVYVERMKAHGKDIEVHPEVVLPVRADPRSAGYDFYCPVDAQVLPGKTLVIWTNVKAYMLDDELLYVYPRSSFGELGVMLANTVGLIDASYYSNVSNDGNIGISLRNLSGKAVNLEAGQRIAQGVFTKYLKADNDETLADERVGGFGSSGK